MDFNFSVITGKVIHQVIHANMQECVRRVGDAYLAHEAKKTVNPDSYFLLFPDRPRDRIIALPASLSGEDGVSGIKWISSYPNNVSRGFPRASAVLVLNDIDTGYPFACLEASIISAARTAGSAVLGARWMTGQPRVRSLGIVGNGLIARYIYEFLMGTGWEVDEVILHDLVPAEAERFAREVCQRDRHRKIVTAPDVETAVRSSELLVLATVAPAPYIHDPGLFAHNPVVLNISLRDLAPEVLLASHNIVDDVDHVMKANTSPHLTEKRAGNRSFVNGTIAQLMQGTAKVDRTRPIIFSPFGMGVLDLAVGRWVYEAAVSSGQDVRISDFFFDLSR